MEYAIEMLNITKEFPGIKANDQITLQVRQGEIHALLGENGAGKSTLMKVLTGIYKKDSGTITYEGKEVEFKNTREAQDAGIVIVHQELNMLGHLTVAQNIFIGREFKKGIKIDDKKMNEEAKKLLIASFIEAGIRVLGVDEAQIVAEEEAEAKANVSEEEQGAIRFYEEELSQMDLPGEEEQKELITSWLADKEDGEAVIESFLPQILEIARNHMGKGVLFGDLVQEGNIGLLEAMAIYQDGDAEGFLAHAKSAVEDSILDAIAMQRGSDSVGEAMAIKANRLDDASTFLSKELGREPKIEELAKYLSMTEEEVKDIMKISLDALSVMEADIKQS